jgi:hypothetical protein
VLYGESGGLGARFELFGERIREQPLDPCED